MRGYSPLKHRVPRRRAARLRASKRPEPQVQAPDASPPTSTIIIDDNIHCDLWFRFQTFEEAISELKRFAATAWDDPPNKAPCTQWQTCGREYIVMELDRSQKPAKVLRRITVLSVSAEGAQWVEGFAQTWAAADPRSPS